MKTNQIKRIGSDGANSLYPRQLHERPLPMPVRHSVSLREWLYFLLVWCVASMVFVIVGTTLLAGMRILSECAKFWIRRMS